MVNKEAKKYIGLMKKGVKTEIPSYLWNEETFALDAIKINENNFEDCSESLTKNPVFIKKALLANPLLAFKDINNQEIETLVYNVFEKLLLEKAVGKDGKPQDNRFMTAFKNEYVKRANEISSLYSDKQKRAELKELKEDFNEKFIYLKICLKELLQDQKSFAKDVAKTVDSIRSRKFVTDEGEGGK